MNRDGDAESSSHLQPPQPPSRWSLPASNDAATYDYNNLYLQDLQVAGGSLCQPSASDIPVSDTAASDSFQLSYSEEPAAGGSQHQPPAAPGIAAPVVPHPRQGSSWKEPPGGGQYQLPFSATPAPNSAPHNFNSYLAREYMGGSLQPGLQFPTGGGSHQAISRSPHYHDGSSDTQALIQAQAAQVLLSLGAHATNDEVHRPSDPENEASTFNRLGQTRDVDKRVPHPSPYEFGPPPPPPYVPPRSQRPVKMKILQISSLVVDQVKKDASDYMTTTLFDQCLLPSVQMIDQWAKSALDDAAAVHVTNREELAAWKQRQEGRAVLTQLKASVKRLHTKSRDYAEGFVVGGYKLSFDLLTDATDAAVKTRKTYATSLVSSVNFTDTFIQFDFSLQRIGASGQLEWFCAPFSHPSVTGMVEYMIVHQQFRRRVNFDSPGWELRLMNVIALAGTLCRWVVSRFSATGWFQARELHTPENESYYTYLKARMASLSGVEKILFRELLVNLRSVFLTYPGF
ncbi:hypothetical protein DEU56DRAFT_757313 [Suillus clintonianus]|uniref:uncharacterized protein n=1 Tax=Suillus clintonianus TaxID=1904413 RepID=UPI001B881CED|nr:uncharacterized protein DEU56DRAFT_757313 [Suillus clintonianus]KAG2132822.1 hypothetical protein DEU56DRAFT_757313 [Suillus clintonianus]